MDKSFGLAETDHFEKGIEIAAEDFVKMNEEGLVIGTLFFGSATFKGTNPSSDIDTFVVVKDFDADTVCGLQATVARVAEMAGVSLELTAYTSKQLQVGEHWERAAKAAWLREQAERNPELIIGCDPTQFINPLKRDLREDVDEYLTNRAQEMTWSLIHGYGRNPEANLEKVFNTPHRTARKTLHVLTFLGYIDTSIFPDMQKSTIATATELVYGAHDPVVSQYCDDIRSDFERYLRLVDETTVGAVSEDEYYQMLHATLGEDLPKAIDFVRRIQPIYRSLAQMSLSQ